MKINIQVSIRTTINSRTAMSLYLYFLPVFNSCRNSNAQAFIVNRKHLLMSFVNISKIQLQFSMIILATEFCLSLSETTTSHIAKHGCEEIGEFAFSKIPGKFFI